MFILDIISMHLITTYQAIIWSYQVVEEVCIIDGK